MALLIIICGAAAMAHFAYESIFAPALRLDIRFKLFHLRDRLRQLYADHSHQIPEETFRMLDESLSLRLERLKSYGAILSIRSEISYREDDRFRDAVAQRVEIINRCVLPEYKSILKEYYSLGRRTEATNCMMLIVYALPLVLIFFPWIRTSNRQKRAAAIPLREVEKFEPSTTTNSYGAPA